MTRVLLQDKGVGVSVSVADRLAEMNERHRRERCEVYGRMEACLYGAALVFMAGVTVWLAIGG